VSVQASNAAGSGTEVSAATAVVDRGVPVVNERPRLVLISARRLGLRVYARFRVCDDSRKNVTIIQTDSRPGVASYTRRFSTLQPPVTCAVYSRSWRPAPRFRGDGCFVVTLRARDKSGLTSAPSRRVLSV
jgi:hypothetical protein